MRFDNSIGVEGQAAAGLELKVCELIVSSAVDAEGECAGQFELAAIEIGREVAGVGDGDETVARDAGGECGGEGGSRAADETLVQFAEHLGWIGCVFCGGTNRADEHGDKHGGGEAFAGNVANDNEQTAAAVRGGSVRNRRPPAAPAGRRCRW